MRKYVSQAVAKRAQAVGNARPACAKTTYLYTLNVFLLKPVHKTRGLSTLCPVVLRRLSHSQKQLFQSVSTVFLPTIHTTYKDNQNLINLFSY